MPLATKEQARTIQWIDGLLLRGELEQARVATAIARWESNFVANEVHPRSKAAGAWQLHRSVRAHYTKVTKKPFSQQEALNPSKAWVVFWWYWQWLGRLPWLPDAFEWKSWAYVSGPARIKRLLRDRERKPGESVADYAKRWIQAIAQRTRLTPDELMAKLATTKPKTARALLPLAERKLAYVQKTTNRYHTSKRYRTVPSQQRDWAKLLPTFRVYRPAIRGEPALLPGDVPHVKAIAAKAGHVVDDVDVGWTRRWRRKGLKVRRSVFQRAALDIDERLPSSSALKTIAVLLAATIALAALR